MNSVLNFKQNSNFCIKNRYIVNNLANVQDNRYQDDEANSRKYQFEVYRLARNIIKKHNVKSVLDIGCGFGTKLAKLIYPLCHNIVGIDCEKSVDYCKNTYNFGEWYIDNIESPTLSMHQKFDLIISSDVIEHMANPDSLIAYIRSFCHSKTIIILSTPERNALYGYDHAGPPYNSTHIREWSKQEFLTYLNMSQIMVVKHSLLLNMHTGFLKDLIKKIIRKSHTNQVAICKLMQ